MENLIKTYLAEKFCGEDVNFDVTLNELYMKYLKGEFQIPKLDFDIWLKHLNTNNVIFAKSLTCLKHISNNEKIVEIALDSKYNVSANILRANKTLILPDSIDASEIDLKGKYLIMNGSYVNCLRYIIKAIDGGKFSIGICGCNNNYTDRIIEQYRILKEFLLAGGIDNLEEIYDSSSYQKIYTLHYNCVSAKREPKKIETYVSNR